MENINTDLNNNCDSSFKEDSNQVKYKKPLTMQYNEEELNNLFNKIAMKIVSNYNEIKAFYDDDGGY